MFGFVFGFAIYVWGFIANFFTKLVPIYKMFKKIRPIIKILNDHSIKNEKLNTWLGYFKRFTDYITTISTLYEVTIYLISLWGRETKKERM